MKQKIQSEQEVQEEGTAYVYLLLCSDGTYYCGYALDPEKRLKTHNSGKGAKYTKSRRPCVLVYTERLSSRSAALRREWELKHLPHLEKKKLAEHYLMEQEGRKDGRTEDTV